MPWPVKDLFSVRLDFVNLAQQPDVNMRQLCRRFGISPTIGYKWLQRFAEGGADALEDRSRRPQCSPYQTEPAVEALLIELRRKHPAWGARKLRRRLLDLGHQDLPATSTITGILHRHGLIGPEHSQAAERYQRFERAGPNELWQLDFKGHFALSQGRCYPLCGVDDHSRYNVLLAACNDQQEATVQGHLIGAFRLHGVPDAILWDNGSPWGTGGGEHTGLDVWLMRLGVRSCHGRPCHPQTQGKEERFNRTLEAEVLKQGGWSDCQHVQRAFDQWRPIYNGQRPHDSLSLDTPASRYRPSWRSYPENLPPVQYAPGLQVRRVDASGWISFRCKYWKIGRAFTHQNVALQPTSEDGSYEVLFLTHIIKLLDLRLNTTKPVLTR